MKSPDFGSDGIDATETPTSIDEAAAETSVSIAGLFSLITISVGDP